MQVHRAILRRVITMLMAIALLGPTASLVHAQAPVLYLPFDGVYKTNANVDHECPFGDPCKDGHMTFYTGEGCVECQDMDEAWTAPYCYPGHSGSDYAHCGQPVLAAATGRVDFAGWAYGWTVKLNHGNAYVTWYSHLVHANSNPVGSWVNRGSVVGTSGSSGTPAPPCHLHFDLRHNDRFTDPYGWTGAGADPLDSAYLDGKYGESSPYLWSDRGDSIVIVEDKSPAKFTGSVPTTNWYRGHSWSMLYTRNNPTTPYQHTGTWRPYLPSAPGFTTAGYYSVLAYVPPEIASTTAARYTVNHASGSSVVEVNQLANRNTWVSLGGYSFRGNSSLDWVTLTNYTPHDTGSSRVAFDAIQFVQYRRYVPLAAKTASMSPVGGTWATGIQVQNLSTVYAANIGMAFYWAVGTPYAGQLAATRTDTVAAGRSKTYYLPSHIPGLPEGFLGSVLIHSDQPLAANVNLVTTTGPQREGASLAAATPATTLYAP